MLEGIKGGGCVREREHAPHGGAQLSGIGQLG
jgi:hypothetical protein